MQWLLDEYSCRFTRMGCQKMASAPRTIPKGMPRRKSFLLIARLVALRAQGYRRFIWLTSWSLRWLSNHWNAEIPFGPSAIFHHPACDSILGKINLRVLGSRTRPLLNGQCCGSRHKCAFAGLLSM